VLGARPRTLTAAVVPVAVGTAVGWWVNHAGAGTPGASGVIVWRAVAVLIVALGVQVGTNYSNDYADGVRGTDADRVGPLRLVASGLAEPASVRRAALVAFAVAAVAGLALAAATSWWLLAIGALCFLAGWTYTGGPRPYGYLGLGEVFVFVFFGLVATMGSAYVQIQGLPAVSLAAAVPVGCLATALLEANNLRDIAGDARAGKRTLAVRLGRRRASFLYEGALLGALAGTAWLAWYRPFALLALLAAPLALGPLRLVRQGAEGRALLPALAATARLQLAVGLLLTLGIVL
jgi:1,4-dihydroxy-2-naphthoate octaprenyltransferase